MWAGGTPGETMYSYGIQSEDSDTHIHVSVCNATLYIFETRCGVDAINKHPEVGIRKAYQPGVATPTAEGYAMPTKYINGMRQIKIPQFIFENANFLKSDSTSEKGRKAVFVVTEMMKRNLVPLSFKIDEITDRTMQIRGTDILVSLRHKIQVKCDWRVGETGNVYLQTAEINPLRMI